MRKKTGFNSGSRYPTLILAIACQACGAGGGGGGAAPTSQTPVVQAGVVSSSIDQGLGQDETCVPAMAGNYLTSLPGAWQQGMQGASAQITCDFSQVDASSQVLLDGSQALISGYIVTCQASGRYLDLNAFLRAYYASESLNPLLGGVGGGLDSFDRPSPYVISGTGGNDGQGTVALVFATRSDAPNHMCAL